MDGRIELSWPATGGWRALAVALLAVIAVVQPTANAAVAPVTLGFTATVASFSQPQQGTQLPFNVATGATFPVTLEIEAATGGPTHVQPGKLTANIGGTLLALSGFRAIVIDNGMITIDWPGRIADPIHAPYVDGVTFGDGIVVRALPDAPPYVGEVTGSNSLFFDPILALSSYDDLIASTDLPTNPDFWNAFPLRELGFEFSKNEQNFGGFLGAYLGPAFVVPEPRYNAGYGLLALLFPIAAVFSRRVRKRFVAPTPRWRSASRWAVVITCIGALGTASIAAAARTERYRFDDEAGSAFHYSSGDLPCEIDAAIEGELRLTIDDERAVASIEHFVARTVRPVAQPLFGSPAPAYCRPDFLDHLAIDPERLGLFSSASGRRVGPGEYDFGPSLSATQEFWWTMKVIVRDRRLTVTGSSIFNGADGSNYSLNAALVAVPEPTASAASVLALLAAAPVDAVRRKRRAESPGILAANAGAIWAGE